MVVLLLHHVEVEEVVDVGRDVLLVALAVVVHPDGVLAARGVFNQRSGSFKCRIVDDRRFVADHVEARHVDHEVLEVLEVAEELVEPGHDGPVEARRVPPGGELRHGLCASGAAELGALVREVEEAEVLLLARRDACLPLQPTLEVGLRLDVVAVGLEREKPFWRYARHVLELEKP